MEINMRNSLQLWGIALTLFGILPIASGEAVKLRDGKTYFEQPPTLIDAYTLQNSVNVGGAVYNFNIMVPQNAGESLQKVEIKQFRAIDDIAIDTSDVQTGVAIAVLPDSKQDNNQDKNISVTFNPPIRAGETINIRLRAVRNPRYGGVYLFGVTAFPQGDNPYGQFLGYGRLTFYDSSSGDN
jgi:hypothetical protein